MTSSSPQQPLCTIIIPTLALAERTDSLNRAIESIKRGNKCAPKVLVVVNGTRFDATLVTKLQARADIELIQIPTPSSPEAILAGRQAISTAYFGFLDDDDEYLPGAVDVRLQLLATHPQASVVVTNGYRHRNGEDFISMEQLAGISDDPFAALFRENWLASCGGLFRTDYLPADLFKDSPRHIHWTWLAFRMMEAGKQVIVLDIPTYRINETSGSASKSETYLLCHIELYRRMLASVSRSDIAEILKVRLPNAYHQISEYYLTRGSLRSAWAAHLSSLRFRSGWKFFPYTRKLFLHR
jgi:hypothetical protein